MDAVQDQAEQETTEEMRQEIDCTRSAMADKMEALEDQVMGTVQSAQETVEDSIQMAQDTVASVKRNFDIKYQIEQHPWIMVGGSFLAGLALGSLFSRIGRPARQTPKPLAGKETPPSARPSFVTERRSNGNFAAAAPPPQPTSANRPGFFSHFQDEIDKVKGMAIGYAMGLARDSIKDTVPQLASQIEDLMNSVTTKLGGVQQHSVQQHSS